MSFLPFRASHGLACAQLLPLAGMAWSGRNLILYPPLHHPSALLLLNIRGPQGRGLIPGTTSLFEGSGLSAGATPPTLVTVLILPRT
jgi:hypothetical protein